MAGVSILGNLLRQVTRGATGELEGRRRAALIDQERNDRLTALNEALAQRMEDRRLRGELAADDREERRREREARRQELEADRRARALEAYADRQARALEGRLDRQTRERVARMDGGGGGGGGKPVETPAERAARLRLATTKDLLSVAERARIPTPTYGWQGNAADSTRAAKLEADYDKARGGYEQALTQYERLLLGPEPQPVRGDGAGFERALRDLQAQRDEAVAAWGGQPPPDVAAKIEERYNTMVRQLGAAHGVLQP